MDNSCYYCSIFHGEQKRPIKGSIFSQAIETSEQTEPGNSCDKKKRIQNTKYTLNCFNLNTRKFVSKGWI